MQWFTGRKTPSSLLTPTMQQPPPSPPPPFLSWQGTQNSGSRFSLSKLQVSVWQPTKHCHRPAVTTSQVSLKLALSQTKKEAERNEKWHGVLAPAAYRLHLLLGDGGRQVPQEDGVGSVEWPWSGGHLLLLRFGVHFLLLLLLSLLHLLLAWPANTKTTQY